MVCLLYGVNFILRQKGGDSSMSDSFKYVNFPVITQAKLQHQPFPYMIVKNVIRPEKCIEVCADFPNLKAGGVYNSDRHAKDGPLSCLIEELTSDRIRQAISKHFDMDLSSQPVMTTLRGSSRAQDGRVHTDSQDKLLTMLLYLNEHWNSSNGRLRLLGSNSIHDTVEEVIPEAGTCVFFKVTDNCWHGYEQYIGQRRQIMMNYMVSRRLSFKNRLRHRFSEILKGT